ncbi:MAG: ABC transporter substrate-binding protein [Rhodothermus sp.]|nr:ABC transporter substrate-binding protein [Rhodothermus sp.]
MNRYNLYLLSGTLLTILLLGSTLPVQAQSSTEARKLQQLLETRDQQIKALLQTGPLSSADREQLKDLINGFVDFETMGRLALGPFWADLSPAQRQEFIELFSDIVREQSLSDLDIYRARVQYDHVEVQGDSARVVTTVIYKETPTQVVYLFTRRNGQWKAYDIIIDEVSTVKGYARSFQSVIRKRGFDALMKSLRKKQARMARSRSS